LAPGHSSPVLDAADDHHNDRVRLLATARRRVRTPGPVLTKVWYPIEREQRSRAEAMFLTSPTDEAHWVRRSPIEPAKASGPRNQLGGQPLHIDHTLYQQQQHPSNLNSDYHRLGNTPFRAHMWCHVAAPRSVQATRSTRDTPAGWRRWRVRSAALAIP
jgi:hypothetical protein